MDKKIATLLDAAKNLKNKQEKIAADAMIAQAEADKLKAAEDAAAAAGNLDEYPRIKADRIKAEEKAFVLNAHLKNCPSGLAPEQVTSTWREYAAQYNKGFSKALAKYEEDRRKLADAYFSLMQQQNDALQAREIVATMLGARSEYHGRPRMLDSMSELTLLPSENDMRFFQVAGLYPSLRCSLHGMKHDDVVKFEQACFDIVHNHFSNYDIEKR